jgi:hypothetical protein
VIERQVRNVAPYQTNQTGLNWAVDNYFIMHYIVIVKQNNPATVTAAYIRFAAITAEVHRLPTFFTHINCIKFLNNSFSNPVTGGKPWGVR